MVLIMESITLEESCLALGGSTKLLFELREGLRKWLQLQPHLPQDITDEKLEQVILGTKMSLEQSKHKLDMFYTLKRHIPELFANRDPRSHHMTELHKMIQIVYLPKLTPEKYSVTVFRPISDDYSKFSAADSAKFMLSITEIQMKETRNLGTIFIIDQAKATLSYVASFTPMLVKKCEIAIVEALAVRVKGIYFINASGVTNKLITLMKKVLKPKLAARISVHTPGNYKTLHDMIPKSILPEDYEGDEISMAELAKKLQQKVDDQRDWLMEQEKIVADERLRPGEPVDTDNLFGISGSFRKLDVD